MTYQLTINANAVLNLTDGRMAMPDDPDYLAWLAVPNTPIPIPVIPLADLKTAFLLQVDADTDAIYQALLGNRESEYALAEKEAQAYKDAGYHGAVPPSVASWTSAKHQSDSWAADDILTAAANWRTAQGAIRAQRLEKKELARNAVDGAALTMVKAQWNGFLSVLKSQLGL